MDRSLATAGKSEYVVCPCVRHTAGFPHHSKIPTRKNFGSHNYNHNDNYNTRYKVTTVVIERV